MADADQGRERRLRSGERHEVDTAQGRVVLVVEAGEHRHALGSSRRRRGAEQRVRPRNLGNGVVGDQHHRRIAARKRPAARKRHRHVQKLAKVHSGLTNGIAENIVDRVVALEHDHVAVGNRGRTGKYIEEGAGMFRHLEEREVRHGAELRGAGDQITERVCVDAVGSQSLLLGGYVPYSRVIATYDHRVRANIDARE